MVFKGSRCKLRVILYPPLMADRGKSILKGELLSLCFRRMWEGCAADFVCFQNCDSLCNIILEGRKINFF